MITAVTGSDDPTFVNGRQRVVVFLSDATTKYPPQVFFALDADDLRRQVLASVASLTAIKSSAKPIQPNTAIDLTPDPMQPPVVDPPTPAVLHQAALVAALQAVRCAKNALTLNVGSQKTVDQSLAAFQLLYVEDTDLRLLGAGL